MTRKEFGEFMLRVYNAANAMISLRQSAACTPEQIRNAASVVASVLYRHMGEHSAEDIKIVVNDFLATSDRLPIACDILSGLQRLRGRIPEPLSEYPEKSARDAIYAAHLYECFHRGLSLKEARERFTEPDEEAIRRMEEEMREFTRVSKRAKVHKFRPMPALDETDEGMKAMRRAQQAIEEMRECEERSLKMEREREAANSRVAAMPFEGREAE